MSSVWMSCSMRLKISQRISVRPMPLLRVSGRWWPRDTWGLKPDRGFISIPGNNRKFPQNDFLGYVLNNDELVKSRFSLPWREGKKGRGKITFKNTATYHPHPTLPRQRGGDFGLFTSSSNNEGAR